MKRMFQFAKTAALVFIGASLVVSCQKESTPEGTEDGIKVTVKSAPTIYDGVGLNKDPRFPDFEGWLDGNGALNFLKEGKNLHDNTAVEIDWDKIPTGIKMEEDGFLYVTYVGKVAKFNNVLGYYYYNPEVQITEEALYNQIFNSTSKVVNVKQVVYSSTTGLSFGTTFKLGKYDGENLVKFPQGTVVGFYLLPDASNGGDPKLEWIDDKPVFIATDPLFNRTKTEVGMTSHIMGQTDCGDAVIAFEDLNSLHSGTYQSDEDYNDLVFVITDNLQTRATSTFSIVPCECSPVDLPYLGENCFKCFPDIENQACLVEMFKEGESKIEGPNASIFTPLFNNASRDGFVEITEGTNLYAHIEYQFCGYYNTIGWYPYDADNNNPETIINTITNGAGVGGVIDSKYIIYTDRTGNHGASEGFEDFGNFAPGKIGFFIIPTYEAQGSPAKFIMQSGKGDSPRFTTINQSPEQLKTQAQVIMSGSCSSLIVAFEDMHISGRSDNDFNDIIFSVTDNKETLSTSKFKFANFYSLGELIEAWRIK